MDVIRNFKHAPTNYAEYLKKPQDERWEIIEGVPYAMSPAPLTEHQRIVGRLFGELYIYLREKECEVFVAPFDVKPFADGDTEDEKIDTVVQPDVVVVCDRSKLDSRGCNGAPDLVIEVLSDSTAKRDKEEKLRLYRRAKVREYWIVDPLNKFVEVIQFSDESLKFPDRNVYSFADDETVKVGIFTDFEIQLKAVFA
jgi:Uma2 family endonuclease